ncbi:MAG: ATP-grasp domain-containing protein [bacterium]
MIDERVAHCRSLVASQVKGRRVILVLPVVAAGTAAAAELVALGAERVLVLGNEVGMGALIDPAHGEWSTYGAPPPAGADTSEGLHHASRCLRALDPKARAAIDAFDPAGEALVLPAFVLDFDHLAGRPNYAARPAAWVALEDKLVVDALWDRLSVPRAPSRVVPVEAAALRAAHEVLDAGRGTVWAGDAREGFHGGATKTRWVQRDDELDATVAFFAARCDRVRVMPFLEGVPCSVHGVVFDDAVVAGRPCEMVVLRRPGQTSFRYAGAATYWDPPADDRDAMRSLAKRVGAALRQSVGFRGVFTLDGVMTGEGFLPTEINPRFGAALKIMFGADGPPMSLLDMVIKSGAGLDYRPAALEAVLIEQADAVRRGGGWSIFDFDVGDDGAVGLCWTGDGYRLAGEGEDAHATVVYGRTGGRSMVRFLPEAAHVEPGRSIAPRVVAGWACVAADRGWPIERLEAAVDVRGAPFDQKGL